MSDYLVIFRIAAGSSFERGPDKDATIQACAKRITADWGPVFDLSGRAVNLAVYDVAGHDNLWWDHSVHIEGTDDIIPLLEAVTVTLPVARKRRG